MEAKIEVHLIDKGFDDYDEQQLIHVALSH